MNPVVLGLLAAVGLGTADFLARFSARRLGAVPVYAFVLLVGAVGSTLWFFGSEHEIVWSPLGFVLAILHGLSVTAMCVLLYKGLALGPVAIVAPIVAAHPALVLAVNVVMGSRPSATQWGAMIAIIAGGILIARTADSHPHFASANREEMRKTLLIASAACLTYVALLLTGQAAARSIGELQTLWIGRCSGLVFVVLLLFIQRQTMKIPATWLPLLLAQGLLDSAGYAALLAGLSTAAPHIAMVMASTFSVFTVGLAVLILKEPVSRQHALAIILISIGSAVLAAST